MVNQSASPADGTSGNHPWPEMATERKLAGDFCKLEKQQEKVLIYVRQTGTRDIKIG